MKIKLIHIKRQSERDNKINLFFIPGVIILGDNMHTHNFHGHYMTRKFIDRSLESEVLRTLNEHFRTLRAK
jgi:hypothetical protein